ncbi:MAG: beta-lactamase family protein [Chitinophagaceae bacterium]|nr:beta-lactamase family protein [Chitinophagaceae bacterium]
MIKPFLSVFISLSCFTILQAQSIDHLIKRFDKSIDSLHQLHEFNGNILLAKDGITLYEKSIGYTDSSKKHQLNLSSAFNLASISKTFTSSLILMYVQERKLNIDDQVSKYISIFPYKDITIRHLLNHTHGMIEYFDWIYDTLKIKDTIGNDQLLALLSKYKPALTSVPGEKFNYCNTGYAVLSEVLETISGMTYPELLKYKITKPLKLKNTYVQTVKMPKSPKNRVYGMKYKDGRWNANDLTTLDEIVGDGNIYSTVHDLQKWDQALRDGKVLEPAILLEAYTPTVVLEKPKMVYGLGWIINEPGKKVSHSGSWNGFKNNIVRDLQNGYTLISLSNGTAGIATYKLLDQFEKAISNLKQ